MVQERDFQLYSKGTDGGLGAPQPPDPDPDVHGLQQSHYPPRIPTSFNTLTVQQRMVHPSTITSQLDHHSQNIFPSSTSTVIATDFPAQINPPSIGNLNSKGC